MFNTKQFFSLFLVIFIVLAGITSVTAESLPPETKTKLDNYYQQAWNHLKQMHKDVKNLDLAHGLYKKALELSPEYSETYWKLAEICFKKAQAAKDKDQSEKLYRQAMEHAETSLEKNPKSIGGLYWTGTCEAQLADIAGVFKAMKLVKKAKKHLKQCIDLDPSSRFANLSRVILAILYTEAPWPIRDLGEAEKLMDKAVELDPNLTLASVKRAKTLIKKGKKELAIKELQRGLKIQNPTYVWDSELYDWPEAKALLAELK